MVEKERYTGTVSGIPEHKSGIDTTVVAGSRDTGAMVHIVTVAMQETELLSLVGARSGVGLGLDWDGPR